MVCEVELCAFSSFSACVTDEVPKYVQAVWQQTGQLRPYAEVAAELEDYYSGLAERAYSARSRSRPRPAMTRTVGASQKQADRSDTRPLSDEERYRRALEVMSVVQNRRGG